MDLLMFAIDRPDGAQREVLAAKRDRRRCHRGPV